MKNKQQKNLFADWLIELANGAFSLSTDGFFKSVKKFISKEVEIYTVLRQQARKVVSEFHHFFYSFPFYQIRDCAIIIRRGEGGGRAEKLELSSKNLDSTPLQNKKNISYPPLLC